MSPIKSFLLVSVVFFNLTKLEAQFDINLSSGYHGYTFSNYDNYTLTRRVPLEVAFGYGYEHQIVAKLGMNALRPKFAFNDPFIQDLRFDEVYDFKHVGLYYSVYPGEDIFRMQVGVNYNFLASRQTILASGDVYDNHKMKNFFSINSLLGFRIGEDIFRVNVDGVFGYAPVSLFDESIHNFYFGLNLGVNLVFE